MSQCKDNKAIDSVKQNIINGTLICGKKGGGNWLKVDRPGDTDYEICEMDQNLCQTDPNSKSGDKCPNSG